MSAEQIADAIIGIYIDQSSDDTAERRGELALDMLDGVPADTRAEIILNLAGRIAEWFR